MRAISTRSAEAASRATPNPFPPQLSRSARRRWGGRAGAAALAALGVLLLLLVLQWSKRSPALPPETPTATVAEGTVIGTMPAAGVIERESPVRVGAALPGQVVEVRASVGDRVARGQVLARLDNLEQRAAFDGADAQLGVAELQMIRAQARFLDTLRSSGDMRDDVPLDELLEGAAGDAQLDLITAGAYTTKQQAAVVLARGLLARRVIRAPVGGFIVERSIAPGETIVASPPGPPLFVIDSRPGRFLVRAEIAEDYVGRVQPGPARILVPAFPDRSFLGEVIGVSPANRTATGPATPTRRRHEVMLAVDNSDGTLRPDLSAVAELPMATSDRALSVPVMAIDRNTRAAEGIGAAERPIVWLVHGTAPPTPLPVEVGVGDGQRVEIRGVGLTPGQRVTLRPTAP